LLLPAPFCFLFASPTELAKRQHNSATNCKSIAIPRRITVAEIDVGSANLLVELLTHGQLGPLKVGQPVSEVIAFCGPPDDTYVVCPGLNILYYGNQTCGPVQLTISGQLLQAIEIDVLGYVTRFRLGSLPKFVLPRSLLMIQSFKEFMGVKDILWQTKSMKDDEEVLRTSVGTEVWFQRSKLMEITFDGTFRSGS
jgi:hypothetical protein